MYPAQINIWKHEQQKLDVTSEIAGIVITVKSYIVVKV